MRHNYLIKCVVVDEIKGMLYPVMVYNTYLFAIIDFNKMKNNHTIKSLTLYRNYHSNNKPNKQLKHYVKEN